MGTKNGLLGIALIAGLGFLFFKNKSNPAGHLFFSVQYLDWPQQEIDITALMAQHPGYSVESFRQMYSNDGYTLLREYYQ